MNEKLIIKDLSVLPTTASSLLSTLSLDDAMTKQSIVLGLSGDLGAGKTTFVQALASVMGVKETVQSPTFSILKIYQTTHPRFKQLIHMDAYRIESLAELKPLRFLELLNWEDTLFCIEWPEKIAGALPSHILIEFKNLGAEERELTVSKIDKN